ncbi:MAG TPA: hypothetical protein PK586_00475 [Casimicrobium sp.]|nr:hypothetical protein [Casimicrobium sp.]
MRLYLIDSVSAVTAQTHGQLVVTGSHGGVSAAHLALAHPPGLVVFNDAGIGLDAAGIAGLELLNDAGVAACAVSHLSARIGDAKSTLATGKISALNERAKQLGLNVAESVTAVVARLTDEN